MQVNDAQDFAASDDSPQVPPAGTISSDTISGRIKLFISTPVHATEKHYGRSFSTVLQGNTYDDVALEAELDAYDRRRAARHAVKREQQRNPKLFGYADFYGWSEDKARQAAEREGASFVQHVTSHGFSFGS